MLPRKIFKSIPSEMLFSAFFRQIFLQNLISNIVLGHVILAPSTLLAELFILPLLFRGLFAAVFTVVVFFHRERSLCHDTIPFPVEHSLSLL